MKKINLINTTALILSILQFLYQIFFGTMIVVVGFPFPFDPHLEEPYRSLFEQYPLYKDLGNLIFSLIIWMLILSLVVVILNFVMMLKKKLNRKLLSSILLIPPILLLIYAILLTTYLVIGEYYADPSVSIPIFDLIGLTLFFSLIYLLNLFASILVALIHHKIIFKNVNMNEEPSSIAPNKKNNIWLILIITLLLLFIFIILTI